MGGHEEIPLVTEAAAERLNERQRVDYRAHRERLVTWLRTRGKEPARAEGYAPATAYYRALRIDRFYRFVWDREDGYTTAVTHTHADAFLVPAEGTETVTQAVRDGNISLMNYATGMTDSSTRDGQAAKIRAARMLAREGMIVLVVGPPGSGKTAFALDVIRVAKSLTGARACGNLEWDGFGERVESDREMFEFMAAESGQAIGFIDEVGQKLRSTGESVRAVEAFSKKAKLLRKRTDHGPHAKQGALCMVGHTRTGVAKQLRQVATAMFQKPSRMNRSKVRLYESEGGKDEFEEVERFKGVTDTTESFDEHSVSAFQVVVDDDEDDESDDVNADEVRNDEKVAALIRAKLNGLSHGDAGELVDRSDSWAGDRWREWRDGEYRDLVPYPGDEEIPDRYDPEKFVTE